MQFKRAKLEEWLKAKLPDAENLTASSLERPTGIGYGHTHYFFSVRWREGSRERADDLVLREQLGGSQVVFDANIATEFRIMKCLANSGVPIPEALWLEEDRGVLGVPFLIMRRIQGEIIERKPIGAQTAGLIAEATPQERAQITMQAIEAIARIHTLDWRRLGLSFLGVPASGTDAIDRQIGFCQRAWHSLGIADAPLMDAVFQWFHEHKFEAKHVSLCWGDSRFGNMMYHGDQVAAVLDWDLAHLGPSEGDLASFLRHEIQSPENGGAPSLPGMPNREEVIRHYESLTGRTVENLFYFDALRNLRACVLGWRVVKFSPGVLKDDSSYRLRLRDLAAALGLSRV